MFNSNEQKENLIKLIKKSKNDIETFLKNFNEDETFMVLLKFLIDVKKMRLSDQEIEAQLKELGFQDDQIGVIIAYLNSHQNILSNTELRFKNLEWRLETKVASRSSHNFDNIEPKVFMKLELQNDTPNSKEILMDTNVTNLVHISHKLEQALIDAKSYRNQFTT